MIDLDELLPAIASGSDGAFARWLAGAEAPLRASLKSFARSVDTEAVVQEALLRVWQCAPRIEGDGRPNALLRFAIVAARNLAVSETRRRRVPAPPIDDVEISVEPATPDPILRRAIAACREKLPSKPKQVLALRLASGGRMGDRELAAVAGMKLNTFLQNFTRARRLLADCLARAGVAVG